MSEAEIKPKNKRLETLQIETREKSPSISRKISFDTNQKGEQEVKAYDELNTPRNQPKPEGKKIGFLILQYLLNTVSMQNIHFIIWCQFFVIQGFDLYLNTPCFFGGDRMIDFMKWWTFLGIEATWWHELTAHVCHIGMILLGLALTIWCLARPILILFFKVPTEEGGEEPHKLIKLIDVILCAVVCAVFTFNCFWDVIFSERESLWRHGVYFHLALLGGVGFFPHAKPVLYLEIIFHWSVFLLMNGLDVFHFFGTQREFTFAYEYFIAMCLPPAFAWVNLYIIKIAEILVALFGFVTAALCSLTLLPAYKSNAVLQKFGAAGVMFAPVFVKLNILEYLIFITGDMGWYNNLNLWEHVEFVFQLFVFAALVGENERDDGPNLVSPFRLEKE